DVCGRASNPLRMSHQVPIIPDHWNGFGGGRDATWGNPAFADARTTNNAMHARKYVVADGRGGLRREDDYYYSGRKYPSEIERGEMDSEELTIQHDFEAPTGRDPWRCTINCGPHYRRSTRSDTVDGQVTLAEAEAILKEWGISRLNY